MCRDTVIFAGPTESGCDFKDILDARYLPPAKQGDIYKVFLKYNPKIIGLIDGNFENTPSPWHKEILFVMSRGVHVFGSSSMGALRAAELHSFGMIGIGKIFEAFKSEALEDDDEVAVIHGPKALGYPCLSEAMVNIRATLEKAYSEHVIGLELLQNMIYEAKTSFYKNRNYGVLIKKFSQKPEYMYEIKKLSLWLEDGRVDLKRSDAIKLIKTIHNFSNSNYEPKIVSYDFQETLIWTRMCSQIRDEMDHK